MKNKSTKSKPNKSTKVLCNKENTSIRKFFNVETPKVLGEVQLDHNINVVKPDNNMEELCEYEKIRLRNIQEREALFAQLGINSAKEGATPVQKQKVAVKKEKVPKY